MKNRAPQLVSLAALLMVTGLLSGCAGEPAADKPKPVQAHCDGFTTLPRISSDRLLLIAPQSAVICDGPSEIPVPAPAALAELLNQAKPVGDEAATAYCLMDDDVDRISIVMTGTNIRTDKPDGQVVFVQTSGCRFAETITGLWLLSNATWEMLERLAPSVRKVVSVHANVLRRKQQLASQRMER